MKIWKGERKFIKLDASPIHVPLEGDVSHPIWRNCGNLKIPISVFGSLAAILPEDFVGIMQRWCWRRRQKEEIGKASTEMKRYSLCFLSSCSASFRFIRRLPFGNPSEIAWADDICQNLNSHCSWYRRIDAHPIFLWIISASHSMRNQSWCFEPCTTNILGKLNAKHVEAGKQLKWSASTKMSIYKRNNLVTNSIFYHWSEFFYINSLWWKFIKLQNHIGNQISFPRTTYESWRWFWLKRSRFACSRLVSFCAVKMRVDATQTW